MKKTLLLLTLLLFTTACTTEPSPSIVNEETNDSKKMKTLKKALDSYTKATKENDAKKLISFIYPKVFTVVPKEKMEAAITKAYASGKLPSIKNVKHLNIEEPQKYDNGIFSIVTTSMTTVIKSPKPDNSEFEAYMLKMLKKDLGTRGNVTFDPEKHLFNIEHTNKTIAINENEGWKFVGLKQAKRYIAKGILPQAIVKKIQ